MNTRYEYPLYAFYDHTGMARHLEKMAAKGWMLEKIRTNGLWRYRRMEPKKLRFAVTYFPSASDFDAVPGEDQQTFYDLCQAAGWEFVAQTFQMQVFCNAQEDPVPLETDPKIQVENIDEAMWRGYMWGIVISLAVAGMGILGVLNFLDNHPLRTLSRYFVIYLFFLSITLGLTQGADLLNYHLWRRKALRLAEEEGRFLPVRSLRPWMNLTFGAVDLLLFLPFLGGNEWLMGLGTLLFVGAILLCYRVAYASRDYMKRRGLRAGFNRVVTFLLTFLLISGVQWVHNVNFEDRAFGLHPSVTYEYKGRTCTAYCDDLRLTIGALTGGDDTQYSNRAYEMGTPLASIVSGYQSRRQDAPADIPKLFYYHVYRSSLDFALEEVMEWTSYDVRASRLSDDLKEEQSVDPAPYGAQAAWYRRHSTSYQYLLRYEDSVLQLYFDWEPTEEQLQTALSVLRSL